MRGLGSPRPHQRSLIKATPEADPRPTAQRWIVSALRAARPYGRAWMRGSGIRRAQPSYPLREARRCGCGSGTASAKPEAGGARGALRGGLGAEQRAVPHRRRASAILQLPYPQYQNRSPVSEQIPTAVPNCRWGSVLILQYPPRYCSCRRGVWSDAAMRPGSQRPAGGPGAASGSEPGPAGGGPGAGPRRLSPGPQSFDSWPQRVPAAGPACGSRHKSRSAYGRGNWHGATELPSGTRKPCPPEPGPSASGGRCLAALAKGRAPQPHRPPAARQRAPGPRRRIVMRGLGGLGAGPAGGVRAGGDRRRRFASSAGGRRGCAGPATGNQLQRRGQLGGPKLPPAAGRSRRRLAPPAHPGCQDSASGSESVALCPNNDVVGRDSDSEARRPIPAPGGHGQDHESR